LALLSRRILPPLGWTLLLAACAGVSGNDPDLYQRLSDRDVVLAAGQLQRTLESAPDGATRSWHNASSGDRGSITPTRTYLSAAGRFCREYREELSLGDQSGRFYHVACRDDRTGSWSWL
jgi:surface antigen